MTQRRRIRAPRPPADRARSTPRDGNAEAAPGGGPQADPEPLPSRRVAGSRAVCIGRVTRYFPRAGAAAVALEGALALGDLVHVRGATTDLVLRVARIERRGRSVDKARAGQEVGLAVAEHVRPRDSVYRLDEEAS